MRRILALLQETSAALYRHNLAESGQPLQEKNVRLRRNAWRFIDDNIGPAYAGMHVNQGKLAEAMTTADFPNALLTYVNRKMVPGYNKKRFNFEPLVWLDQTANFLPVTRLQNRAGLDDLEFVGSLGTPRPGNYDDAILRQYQVYDWMKVYPFDRHAIVNDDIGYFADLTDLLGKAARRTLEKFISNLFNNVVSRAYIQSLGALYYSTAKLSSYAVSDNRMAFNQRLDNRGEPINAVLSYIVYHSGLDDKIRQIRDSEKTPEDDLNSVNVVRNFAPIEDPYMSGTAPNLPWYSFTDWEMDNIRPLVLARMAGVPSPALIQKTNQNEVLTTMGAAGLPTTNPAMMGDYLNGQLSVKVHDIWGTYINATEGNWFDVNGAFYNDGTAV